MTSDQIAAAMQDARNYTLALYDSFAEAAFDVPANVPRLSIINPPLWELGHIAWFAEWYILREASSSHPATAVRPSLLTRGDDWFDSNTVAHHSRWTLGLPGSGALKMYCREVLDRALDKLSRAGEGDDVLYPYRLALAHEDMHGEAFAYTLQTLGVTMPPQLAARTTLPWGEGEILFPGGTLEMGSRRDEGFVFDNEKWAHSCYVPPFAMDATPVSNAQYAEFVEDGGYQDSRYWSTAGLAWLMQQESSSPRYWVRAGRHWQCMRFGRDLMLVANEPVRHVNLYEAQAYCAWAGRRLPNEAEWELAALSGHPAFHWGDLWEWTGSPFEPYPGFTADAYREYSEPWFMTHQALRGASFATAARIRSPKYRNFFKPERNDIFAGFRTCAI